MITRIFRLLDDGTEIGFYIETDRPLSERGMSIAQWLCTETFQPERTGFSPHFPNRRALRIGPRLNVETPFSSNAVSIFQACGVPEVARVERFRRRVISNEVEEADAERASGLDPMTEMAYWDDVTTFDPGVRPEPTRLIPVLEEGEDAVRRTNKELGLGFDPWDVTYFTGLFQRYGRNPSDVELLQLGNMNSEHCRHHLYKGKLVIDGEEMPQALLDLIRAPLQALEGPDNITVRAFDDNAGAIKGFETVAFVAECPGHPSRLIRRSGFVHITCTAETHNHPTLIAPYPGAETGAGGRIRDGSAVGRGSLPVAGLAGYCVGNFFLPDFAIPGEDVGGEAVAGCATPIRILIEGSDGVSAYGNQFGEPLIGGYTRSFGLVIDGVRYEYRKPILYSAGFGLLAEENEEKRPPETGMLIVRIGGPAFQIGVGGGSASSMVQGAQAAHLDFNSVQRGNAEMEQRANRVIRACIEMGLLNPIESIHDQGAGGPSNVLTELLVPAGGRLDIRKIVLGDRTMSVLKIWSAEFQEGYGLLIRPERLEEFLAICERERVNCEVVGEITGDGRVTVVDSSDGSTPVDLVLDDVLTGVPRKTFGMTRIPRTLVPLSLPSGLTVADALERVFRLPQVGSKGFLVRKVDRSVTGLVARQQCCGPAQIPVADVAVTAIGYFDLSGAAAAIGENPNRLLVSPVAGARMAVGEMLTNMASALITRLGDVRCRANWMWPAKLPGEGPRLYDAASAMSAIMIALGIAADGGKDSSSMAATVNGELVKSPGELVILGYAPVPDITRVMTPDFRHPGRSCIGYVDLGCGRYRMGGSGIAQAFGQIGDTSPDVDDPELLKRTFEVIQRLIRERRILALHDRSDGGLITTLVEMALAANCGADVFIDDDEDLIAALFSEELGFALEFDSDDERAIWSLFAEYDVPFAVIGRTTIKPEIVIRSLMDGYPVFCEPLSVLRRWWEATSSRLEREQANPEVVEAEWRSFDRLVSPSYRLTFRAEPTPERHLTDPDRPRVAILREEGTNGDREMAAAFFAAGLDPWDVTMSDLIAGRATLDDYRGVVFCGGFSFKDTFDSGKGWAAVIRFNPALRAMFDRFYDRPDTFSLGVCNGCQLMALLGWVPWRDIHETHQPRFIRNMSGRFESRWTSVQIMPSPSILLRGMAGSRLGVWVAHGEGRLYVPDAELFDGLRDLQLAPLAFVDPDGEPTEAYPYNPNGSPFGLTATCSRDGRHLAMMPHPERGFLKWQWPWMPEDWQRDLTASPWLRMFQNAREWCLENAVH